MSLVKQPASTAAANPPASIEAALEGSLVELQALEKMLFQNGQRQAGVFLAQIKLIVVKMQHGIVAGRTDFLSVLLAAQRVPRGQS